MNKEPGSESISTSTGSKKLTLEAKLEFSSEDILSLNITNYDQIMVVISLKNIFRC